MAESKHKSHVEHGDRSAHNKSNINRIRRIQGQLDSLARKLEADEGSCEERVVLARTAEKGIASLIANLIECHIENTVLYNFQHDPESAQEELSNLLKLVNKYK